MTDAEIEAAVLDVLGQFPLAPVDDTTRQAIADALHCAGLALDPVQPVTLEQDGTVVVHLGDGRDVRITGPVIPREMLDYEPEPEAP